MTTTICDRCRGEVTPGTPTKGAPTRVGVVDVQLLTPCYGDEREKRIESMEVSWRIVLKNTVIDEPDLCELCRLAILKAALEGYKFLLLDEDALPAPMVPLS